MVKPIPRPSAERGQILILTALSMTVLLGISALALDASFMYEKRNRLYAAADAAAKAGAIEVWRDSTLSTPAIQTFAEAQVYSHGFIPIPIGTTVVLINHPPQSGPFVGQSGY